MPGIVRQLINFKNDGNPLIDFETFKAMVDKYDPAEEAKAEAAAAAAERKAVEEVAIVVVMVPAYVFRSGC